MSYEGKELGSYVSGVVIRIMKEKQIKVKKLAEVLHEDMGFVASNSAACFISDVRSTGTNFWVEKLPNTERSHIIARRLALLLNGIDVKEDRKVISELRIYYGDDFEYPPKERKKYEIAINDRQGLDRKYLKVMKVLRQYERYIQNIVETNADEITPNMEKAGEHIKKIQNLAVEDLEKRIN